MARQTWTADALDGIRHGFAVLERPFQIVDERISGATPYLHWPGTGRKGDEFTEQFYVVDADVAAALIDIAAADPGPDHLVSAISVEHPADDDDWTTAGYEVGSSEPFMAIDLTAIAPPEPGYPVARVTTLDEATRIADAHRAIGYPVRQFNQALLDVDAIRYLQIMLDGLPVCVGKIALTSPCAYVTDIVTLPDYRKRGLATALMHALHAEAGKAGIARVALTSTAMAKPLYASLGYQVVAQQVLWCTPERN